MKLPIKDLKELAQKRELTHVIVFAMDEDKICHIATYGNTIENCCYAADFGNQMKVSLGWPESLLAEPSRVQKLKEENKKYKETLLKIASLKDNEVCWNDSGIMCRETAKKGLKK